MTPRLRARPAGFPTSLILALALGASPSFA